MKLCLFTPHSAYYDLILLLAVLTLSLVSFEVMAQGPVDGFYKGKGNIVAGIGLGYDASDTYFAGTKEIALTRNSTTAALFGIAGLHERLDVALSIPYVQVNDEGGLQDGSVYLKYRAFSFDFSSSKLELSAAAGISAPLSDYKTEVGSSIGQQATVIDLRPIVHFQADNGWFATGQFGYMIKSDPTPAASGMVLKVGKAASEHYFDVWYTNQFADGGLDYRCSEVVTTFKELGTDFHKVGGTYYRPVSDKVGLYIGANSVLAGRNISKSVGGSLGMVVNL